MEITDLIPTARVLTRTLSLGSGMMAAVTHSEEPTDRYQWPYQVKDRKVPPRTKIMCYNCKKFGHIAKYCSLIQGNKIGEAFVPAAALSAV